MPLKRTGCFIEWFRCPPQSLLELNVPLLQQHLKQPQDLDLGVDVVGGDELVHQVLEQEQPGLVRLKGHF